MPLIKLLILSSALILMAACDGSGNGAADDPTTAYQSFFTELSRGNTQQALEKLAPEGALGSTFHGASYYMMAQTVEQQFEEHGGLQEIVIDREEHQDEESVSVEGRLILRDGTEIHRRILFIKEGERWVGKV
ncbi:MAG: hypothetical protein LAT50_12495 [Ectothiorhodospiraceae bacterium]|nr:DUF4878 domain-containing protein [Paracoccaceae bacterium]MCH8505129.1 hypothetical protein [Ectothiorhodospiraceae bacterium]